MSASFIEQFIHVNKIKIVFPLTNKDVKQIADKLNYKLVPKNLDCNGQKSPLAIYAESRKLMFVVYSLRKYCNENKLSDPHIPEAWDDIIKPESLGF